MADITRKGDIEVNIVDKTDQTAAIVDTTGRLLVSNEATAPPPNTTQVIQTSLSSINSQVDSEYTIPNGETLTVQQLQAGAQDNTTGGSKVTLYEDPNGDKSVLNLIVIIFVNGASNTVTINQQYSGDGTRRIVTRRDVYAGSSREVFARWTGYRV